MMQPQSPARPSSPSADAPVIAGGGSFSQFGNAAQDFHRAERSQLLDQLTSLQSTRNTMSLVLSHMPAKAAERPLLQAQIAAIDGRIGTVDGMLASAQAQAAAEDNVAVVGVPPFAYQERAIPKDVFALAGLFMVVVILPLTIAIALRILRRGKAAAPLPSGMADRLERMETAIESTAIEVERIGEGQRYLTRLLGERNGGEEIELSRVEARGRISAP
jgi:hypothetical protein